MRVKFWTFPGRVGVCAVVGLIRIYRLFVSPLLGPRCRFYPSCSQYGIAVFRKYGFSKGVLKTVVRLCKCHPFHPGGVDLP